MKLSQKTIFFSVIIILILGVVASVLMGVGSKNVPNGKYDDLAICLKDKGAVFYGAFWCVHCNNTKKMFGSSAKLLPYIECSSKKGEQLPICKDKEIKGYPTWEFADGSRLTGEVSFETLANKTGCFLPE